jgi:RecG-like helicase
MEFGKTNMLTEKFTFAESTEECWSIYVPDYEEEKLLHEIRELIKRDNCLGVSFAKIDNMTIKDMWDIINNKLDKENQALLIKLYIQNLYHKQKFHKHTKVIVHPDWDSANREEYGIDEIHTITGSRADNEHIEVTFNKGSKFTEKHGRNYDDVVQIDFV